MTAEIATTSPRNARRWTDAVQAAWRSGRMGAVRQDAP